MHILLIPSWYKSPANPFMGSFFEEQARALMKAGNKVSIFFPNFFPLKDFFQTKSLLNQNCDDNGLMTYVYAVQSFFPRSKRINNAYLLFRSDLVFKKYFKKEGMPDLIHCHSIFDAGIIGLFLSRKYHIPMVITEHLTHFTNTLKGDAYKLRLAAYIFKSAHVSLAVSNQFKTDLERELKLPAGVFKVVYNMVGEQFYQSFIPKKYNAGEEFVFFTNSFLNARKNHHLLFESLKLLIDKNLPVKLVVGGSGETEGALKQFVQSLGINKCVEFLGGLTRQEVKEHIDKSHAFLLGSKFESFGVVLIESLASGRPVISTNSGGPAEIIRKQNGILVNSFEAKDFSAAMEKMIFHYQDFDQVSIQEDCFIRFSEKTISDELMNYYEQALKKNKLASVSNMASNKKISSKGWTATSWSFILE